MFNRKLIVLAGALALAAPAFAQGVGPVSSPVGAGKFFFGGTVSYADNDWELSDCPAGATCDSNGIKENLIAAKAGYGFTDNWAGYVKAGMANSKEDGAGFTYGYAPLLGAGVKGKVYSKGKFSTGPSFSYTFFATQKKDITFAGYPMEAKFKSHWDATFAWGFEGRFEKAAIYGGPMFYKTQATVEACSFGTCASADVENKSNVGAYVGVGFAPDDHWRVGLELAHRAGLSATVGVVYAW